MPLVNIIHHLKEAIAWTFNSKIKAFLVGMTATIITTCTVLNYISDAYSKIHTTFFEKGNAKVQADLTPIFNDHGIHRVDLIPDNENLEKLRNEFNIAQFNIKIVTIDGGTWIQPSLSLDFRNATKRVPVTILMMNFSDKNIKDIWNSAMITNGTSAWDDIHYLRSLSFYKEIMNNSKSKLTIGLYNIYPWTRFTIFDDKAVSFIMSPLMKGDYTPKYFSRDPEIIKCFEAIYQGFLESARNSGHYFSEEKLFDNYISIQSALSETKIND